LLSSEVQSSAQFSGFPVKIAGLEARKAGAEEIIGGVSIYCPENGEVRMNVYNASVEEVERLVSEIKQVETVSTINRIILDAIIREGVMYLEDEQSLEDTLNSILMRVNLFLAE
jgi:uncharacterized protein YheU (UPF0270 family)